MLKDIVYCENLKGADSLQVSALSEKLSISPVTARVMMNRGIGSYIEADAFLHPDSRSFIDPYLLPDMAEAVERIREAIESEERICIYGDYDTDGVCATAILYKTLLKIGARVEYFIPDRHKDGYGMHKSTVEKLCESGVDLIITVDNGITAIEEIQLCTEYCTDVIVTDHHLPKEVTPETDNSEGGIIIPGTQKIIPDCLAVVAASRPDSSYPFKYLCGSGVALKLSVALTGKIDDELLGLCCIATVADVVPMMNENRAIVQLGMPYVIQNAGVSLLLENAGFEGTVNEQTIGFVISPRINAAGRMGDANRAIRLLITDDPEERAILSDELEAANNVRKEEENRVVQEIFKQHKEQEFLNAKVIVLKGKEWNPGVLGIVASKLEERFYCPVILFTASGENIVGSGRSIPGIHLHKTLTPLQHHFIRFGGHSMAVGITIGNEADYNAFVDELYSIYEKFDDGLYLKRLEYDQVLDLSDASFSLCRELESLAPFGEGNPAPVFLGKSLSAVTYRKIGKNEDHLDGTFAASQTRLPFVAFKMGERYGSMSTKAAYDVLFSLSIDTFRDTMSLKLRVIEFKETGCTESEEKSNAFLTVEEYNKICCFNSFTARILRPERYETIERKAFDRTEMQQSFLRISEMIGSSGRPDFSVAERIRLCVFYELGFFVLNENGKLDLPEKRSRRSLTESTIYQLVMPK